MTFRISEDFVGESNRKHEPILAEDYDALARQLARRQVDIAAITRAVMNFGVAIPTWGVGTGGTRFARFP